MFLQIVLRQTEANKLVVGNVFGNLGINLASLKIVVSVLLFLSALPVAAVVVARLGVGIQLDS